LDSFKLTYQGLREQLTTLTSVHDAPACGDLSKSIFVGKQRQDIFPNWKEGNQLRILYM
jgi:hypothetical protein